MKKIIGMILLATLLLTALASCGGTSATTTAVTGGDSTTTKGDSKKVKVIDIKLSEEEYAFAVNKNDADLLDSLNDFLAEIKDNGKFDEIVDKYFGSGTKTPVTSAEKDTSNREGQLWVATNSDFEPFEYKLGNKFLGIDMEIMALFADHLDKELVIEDMDFDAVVTSLGADKCDIGAAGLTVSDTRKQLVNFSDSYYNAAQVLVVKDTDTTFDACTTKADVDAILKTLTNKDIIGAQNGTTGLKYIEGDAEFEFDKLPATSKGYASGALAMQDMLNGNIKFVIIDEAPAKAITAKINKLA